MKIPAMPLFATLVALSWTQSTALSAETAPVSPEAALNQPAEGEFVVPAEEPKREGLLSRLFGSRDRSKDRDRGLIAPLVRQPAPKKKDGLLSRLFGGDKKENSSGRTLVASIGESSPRPEPREAPAPRVAAASTPAEVAERPPQRARKGLIGGLLEELESIGDEEEPVPAAAPVEVRPAPAPEPEPSGRFARLFNQGKERRSEATSQKSERRALLSRLTESFSQPRRADLRFVRTTAYTHTEADHRKWGLATACGTRLQAHRKHTSAAADWSVFPPGTKFRIVGDPTLYVVEDYGRALVGTETIDIYKPSRAAMNHWGVRNVQIEIIELGSFQTARQILESRLHHAHCKAMYRAIRPKIWSA